MDKLYRVVIIDDDEFSADNLCLELKKYNRLSIDGMARNGVLDQIRRRSVPVQLEQGINTIRVYPVTPGFVLEKIVIYPHGNKPAEAYLGPTETYRCRS